MGPPVTDTIKVTVHIKRRRDGGLRVWSDELPGLVLSSRDPEQVLADVAPAIEVIVSEMLGYAVHVEPLVPLPSVIPAPGRRFPLWSEAWNAFAGRRLARANSREYVAARCMA